MKTLPEDIPAHLAQNTTVLCTCWKITRIDGTVFRFTDSDQTVFFADGQEFVSNGAYKRSAIENTGTLSVDNLEVQGIADTMALPEADLRTGLFDGATVEIYVTPWQFLIKGEVKMRKGFFGAVTVLTNNTYTVELRGLLQRLSHVYTEVYSSTCSVDLGSTACGIAIDPPLVARSTAYTAPTARDPGQFVKAPLSTAIAGTYTKLPILDPGFETLGPTGTLVNAVSWVQESGDAFVPSATQKKTGTYSIGSTGAGTMVQDIDLVFATGLSTAVIDAGQARFVGGGWRLDGASSATFGVQYLDSSYNIVAGSPALDTSNNGSWTRISLEGAIAANTRYIRYIFTSTAGSSYLDSVYGSVIDTNGTSNISNAFDNYYYECTTAGTTAATAPTTYGTSSVVTDGTATFTRRDAWTRAGLVTDSDGKRIFRAQITEPRAVDAWFNGGVVTFETGPNAGVSVEVKNWTSAGGEIELFVSAPNDIEPGDYFRIYPGCDKSRISCAAIFKNILNFRGFPDIPGQDELFAYPDARS